MTQNHIYTVHGKNEHETHFPMSQLRVSSVSVFFSALVWFIVMCFLVQYRANARHCINKKKKTSETGHAIKAVIRWQ